MSRELLKRIQQEAILPDDIDDEIQAYLAQPEPEPVGWLYDFQSDKGMVHNWFTPDEAEIEQSHALNIRPLYTSPPDQSARVASLTERLLRDEVTRLEQQLALQAKRDPLSSELLTELAQQANKAINPYYEFARAIEAAHGIGG